MAIGYTDVRALSLKDLRLANEATPSDENKLNPFIQIPKFQRGIVWTDSQRESLIESIYQGFPVGALLCFESGDLAWSVHQQQDNRKVWQLIDGLQRTTALLNYQREPLLYAPVGELLTDEQLSGIQEFLFGASSSSHKNSVLEATQAWLRATKTLIAQDGFVYTRYRDKYLYPLRDADLVSEPKDLEDFDNLLMGVTDFIQKRISAVNAIKIPIIVYSGGVENVPTIFERVNSKGLSLSKYQIFAAAWVNQVTAIESADIRLCIKSKYQKLVDEGYEVEGFNEDEDSASFSLYEYLYGLGQRLAGDPQFGFLFPDPKTSDEVAASIAFNIATVAHGLRVKDMGKLADLLGPGVINLVEFEKALVRSSGRVAMILRPYLGIKLNQQSADARFLPHSANQIQSLILRHLLETHDPKTWAPVVSANVAVLEKNIPSHYLFDIIAGHWRGPVETRLWEMCWAQDLDANDNTVVVKSSHYLAPVSDVTWRQTLAVWHDGQLGQKQKVRAVVPIQTKVFLKFVYSQLVSVHHNFGTEFELEHLYPVDYLKTIIAKDPLDEGWPITATGNLSLLHKDVNQAKGKTMLGDYLNSPAGANHKNQYGQAIQTYVIVPDLADLRQSRGVTKAEYMAFCTRRFDAMVNVLLGQLIQ